MKPVYFTFIAVLGLAASVAATSPAVRNICEVHNIPMELKSVPVHYGLIRYPKAYSEAKRLYFPHGWEYVNGGCIVQKEKTATTYVCPKCKEAADAFPEIMKSAATE